MNSLGRSVVPVTLCSPLPLASYTHYHIMLYILATINLVHIDTSSHLDAQTRKPGYTKWTIRQTHSVNSSRPRSLVYTAVCVVTPG
jgi:hypothetical protein